MQNIAIIFPILGGAASALIHFEGLVTDIVDCFDPLFVGFYVKVKNFFRFHLRRNVQVERLCLVNMTLTYATSFDGPLLVDSMCLFVEPECFVVQIWCRFWCERTFLFFDEEFLKIGSIPAVVFAMLDVEPVGATAIK